MNERTSANFFKTLSSIASFFSQSSKRSNELKKFIEAKIPNVCKTKWAYTSRMVHVVEENYEGILTCFGEIYLGDSDWDSDACTLARGIHSAMLEFNFVFQLKVFAAIFAYTDVLYGVLQTKELDTIECHKSVQQCRTSIGKLKSESRKKEIIEKSMELAGCANAKNKSADEMYDRIIDRILGELDSRFKGLGTFRYVGLLNSSKFKMFDQTFPKDLLQSLKAIFGESFDIVKLTNELKVIFSKEEFASKKVNEIIMAILNDEMDDVFSESLKLSKLILTLPSTTATVERSFSILRRVKNYMRSTMGEERLFYLMLMAVEGEFLNNMMKRSSFYDELIDDYSNSANRRIPLLYK